uniref:Uncharacterized protein n=1 Tax=Sinocyclocheilus grahami TaxID=75366 RepID=A0A672PYH9_SINGR
IPKNNTMVKASLFKYKSADANLSCSEAMLMLQSLKELAEIEDAEHLRKSLSDLHNSASVQQREITVGSGTCKENSSKWEKNSKSLKTVLKKEELIRKVNEIE